MSYYKVGDHVRLRDGVDPKAGCRDYGKTFDDGVVTETDAYNVMIKVDGWGIRYCYLTEELERVTAPAPVEPCAEYQGGDEL